jgi:hypothetical protein
LKLRTLEAWFAASASAARIISPNVAFDLFSDLRLSRFGSIASWKAEEDGAVAVTNSSSRASRSYSPPVVAGNLGGGWFAEGVVPPWRRLVDVDMVLWLL